MSIQLGEEAIAAICKEIEDIKQRHGVLIYVLVAPFNGKPALSVYPIEEEGGNSQEAVNAASKEMKTFLEKAFPKMMILSAGPRTKSDLKDLVDKGAFSCD